METRRVETRKTTMNESHLRVAIELHRDWLNKKKNGKRANISRPGRKNTRSAEHWPWKPP